MHSLSALARFAGAAATAATASSAFTILEPENFTEYLNFGTGDGGGALDENGWARTSIPYFETDNDERMRAIVCHDSLLKDVLHALDAAAGQHKRDSNSRVPVIRRGVSVEEAGCRHHAHRHGVHRDT